MEIEDEYNRLMKYFGESNIKTEYILDSNLEILDPRQFSQIKLTYLPLNLEIIGDRKLTQLENAVDALRRLKLVVNKE
ncbi:hypothetical protein LV716_13810 [Flagellimonas sp. HMM57]|uniref:hypothetical protein n=1 Tax=unclassified Flagellimonas TaxID=2644544 RepID=UPI0013D603CB|nr:MULTISPECIES: hypothetical protein [unclassified Flagellimonas]UII75323.1 hypothetical protein LV716_13810 [Flagellimonas sp. HMM57]